MNAVKSRDRQRVAGAERSYQLAIEPEVFWRLGAPPHRRMREPSAREQVNAMFKHRYIWSSSVSWSPRCWHCPRMAQDVVESPLGETVEKHLPGDEPLRPWTHDPQLFRSRRAIASKCVRSMPSSSRQ